MSELVKSRGFNITLEILQGCKYNCAGCMVDKNFDPGPFDLDGPGLLSLVDEMSGAGYDLTEFTVGPVDIISSRVGLDILDHPLISSLVSRYNGMVLPLALLSDAGLPELCQKLNVVLAGKQIKVAVPFPISSIRNEKHIDIIRDRVRYIIDHMPKVKFELLYLTVNMVGDLVTMLNDELDKEIHLIDFGVRRLVEYVFPHSRKGFDDIINRQAFLRSFSSFSEMVKGNRSRYLIKPLDDSLEVTYRAGKLYYTPTLIEKFPLFSNEYVISRPWELSGVEALEQDLYINELTHRVEHPVCGDCIHLDRCARGDIHLIMTHLNYNECLVNIKNDWTVPI